MLSREHHSQDQRAKTNHSGIRYLDQPISILLLGTLFYITFGLAFSNGVCVADDAYIATVSKYLATGHGYSSAATASLDVTGTVPFQVGISTGPTLILPVAAAMKIFGTSPLVPPVCSTALWAGTLLLILALLYRSTHARFFAFTPGLIVLSVFSVFPWHFEQWYTMLGEVEAALLLFLAIVCLCILKPSARSCAFAGLLFGLAFNTKLLAVFAAPALAVAFYLTYLRPGIRSQYKSHLTRLMVLCAAASLPTVAFELWKLASLGFSGYQANWHDYLTFIKQEGTASSPMPMTGELARGLTVLAERFSLGPWKLAVILVAMSAALFRQANAAVRHMVIAGVVGSGALFSYWILFSTGRPRYVIIALILFFMSAALLPLALRFREGIIYLGIMTFALGGGISRMGYPMSSADHGLYRASGAQLERDEAVKVIEKVTASKNTLLVSQWWAAFIDIQYCLPGVVNIHRLDQFKKNPDETVLFVARRQWLDPNDSLVSEALSRQHTYLYDGHFFVVIQQ